MGPSKDLSWSHSWCLLNFILGLHHSNLGVFGQLPLKPILTKKNISYTLLFSFVLQFQKKTYTVSILPFSKTSRRLLYVSENGFSHSMASSMINKRIKDGIWGVFPKFRLVTGKIGLGALMSSLNRKRSRPYLGRHPALCETGGSAGASNLR